MTGGSIVDIVTFHARRRGGKTAVFADAGDPLSYAELDDRCRRFAAFLRSRGIAKGDRVVLLLRNVPEFVIAYFGAIAAGCVAVPVNYRLSPPEVAYILAACAASVVVTTSEQFDNVAGQEGVREVGNWLLVDGRRAGSLPFGDALS
ncbi:MAG TPA: AMP-binding protein, partial [Thermodesulfobacteriota bacterium]|nr:AMP-binding protein [Thermodesulfobacteriota bacterium]